MFENGNKAFRHVEFLYQTESKQTMVLTSRVCLPFSNQ